MMAHSLLAVQNEPQDEFRRRAQSLDLYQARRRERMKFDDCETTYKIYNKILNEGNNY